MYLHTRLNIPKYKKKEKKKNKYVSKNSKTYLSPFFEVLLQCLSNFGTISEAVSSGFIDHKSVDSKGFLKPLHARASNHAKASLDGKDEFCSGHGLSTYLLTTSYIYIHIFLLYKVLSYVIVS